MACKCHAKSVRHFEVGTAPNVCKATVTVESECDQVDLDEEYGDDEERRGRRGCRVAYKVSVSAGATASAVQLTVEDEEFEFLAPIGPGKNDFAQLVSPDGNCEKKKVGKVKLTCAAGGKAVVIDRFEVCVLS